MPLTELTVRSGYHRSFCGYLWIMSTIAVPARSHRFSARAFEIAQRRADRAVRRVLRDEALATSAAEPHQVVRKSRA